MEIKYLFSPKRGSRNPTESDLDPLLHTVNACIRELVSGHHQSGIYKGIGSLNKECCNKIGNVLRKPGLIYPNGQYVSRFKYAITILLSKRLKYTWHLNSGSLHFCQNWIFTKFIHWFSRYLPNVFSCRISKCFNRARRAKAIIRETKEESTHVNVCLCYNSQLGDRSGNCFAYYVVGLTLYK